MIAAVYARKSTDQSAVSDDQKSVARQVEHAREYAQSKGWMVAEEHVYIDDGISGAEFANRPGFLRLMNSLKPRAPFQVLVMSEESRLGREAIETAFALKQLVSAGVRVFFYLEDRERTLDSPTDKVMLSLTTFADELEREKARQRTYDAMQRKAKAGHVTGGSCFGYRNVEVAGLDGQRSHVRRVVDDAQAEVIRRIFHLCAAGHGLKAIAKQLNSDRAISPRAQLGRSRSWAPGSAREVLYRTAYRGVTTWNASRKRDRWGQHHQTARPESEWIRIEAPDLRIVTDAEWQAAHAALAKKRGVYFTSTKGQSFGRPANGAQSRYLLTDLARCGRCGGSMRVRTRKGHGARTQFLGCASYHERGRTVCSNCSDVPLELADGVVIEVLLDDVLDQTIIHDAVSAAVSMICDVRPDDRLDRLADELAKTTTERDRLVSAIAAGGQLPALLSALQAREDAISRIQSDQRAIASQGKPGAADARRVERELIALAANWRSVLASSPEHARPIITTLLDGRVTFTPNASVTKSWTLTGKATLSGLFSREVFPSVWRPHRDSIVTGIELFRRF